jgi:hypothetical protein
VKVAQQKTHCEHERLRDRPRRASSYEMTVNNSVVVDTSNEYIKALSAIVRNKPDVIGYVFAINGHVNSADIYASRPCL